MTTKKKTTKKKSKQSKKKTTRRRLRSDRWDRSQDIVIAVKTPADVHKAIPEGFELTHANGLGVCGGKLWLHITILPKR